MLVGLCFLTRSRSLKDVEHSGGRLHLVFEWVDKDLKGYMDKLKRKPVLEMMDMKLVKSYMYQLLRGMDFCHRRGIMHRDMKPQNLLVSKDGVLKIADFGLSRAFMIPVRAYTHEVVTLWYRAPEILLGQKAYAPAVDMWSIGAIFAEMVNRHPLWPADCEFDELSRIFRTLGTPTETSWPGVSKLPDWNDSFGKWPRKPLHKVCPRLDANGLDLFAKLLEYDPARRITARDSMAHPWFDDLDKASV